MKQAIERLYRCVDAVAFSFYQLNSRIHPIRSFSTPDAQVYLKRDDELSFGISGSKFRKYSTLIPHLIKNRVKEAVVIGGAYSNNVLGLSQLMIENGIRPILLLRRPGSNALQGNYLLTRLLVPPEDIVIIDREEWQNVDQIAIQHAQGSASVVIPEGAFMEESLPGALSLALDIMRNEQEIGKDFDHIFIDSGTGMQAIALLLGLSYCKHKAKIHIVLLAQSNEEFERQLQQMLPAFERLLGESVDIPSNYVLHRPEEASSFGSVTKKGLMDVVEFARKEGVLLDPIYSGKLLSETKRILKGEETIGQVLVIHSGGGLTLSGFQSRLEGCLL